ncbi:ankyrin repeat-containing domain, PGG domain protein, partial [Tanacetum coccineum]
MKGTASQCMVVATLIATIVFAAAFTVPGGYTQSDDHKNKGLPVFHSEASFVIFVVADAISLFASSGSIIIFLSILTSRYAERDFLESIPNKLMAGLATLFISIATMTLAFSVSFFVLYQQGVLWIPILIAVFAVLPVILYLFLQYGLFFDIIRSTPVSTQSTYLSRTIFVFIISKLHPFTSLILDSFYALDNRLPVAAPDDPWLSFARCRGDRVLLIGRRGEACRAIGDLFVAAGSSWRLHRSAGGKAATIRELAARGYGFSQAYRYLGE